MIVPVKVCVVISPEGTLLLILNSGDYIIV